MNVELRRKAELFHKALEDIWVAEQIWQVTPNIAVWHCTQAAEKIMKGHLFCFNKEFGYDHDLKTLLREANKLVELTDNANETILYLDEFKSRLRYRHMPTDPTAEDAKLSIAKAKSIIDEFGKIPDISSYISEAKEVHAKILKSFTDRKSKQD